MRIGIISDSDHFIPLAGALVSQQIQVYLFYSLSPDLFVNQKVSAFSEQFHLPYTEEKHKDRDIYEWISRGKYDVCFIIGYSRLIRLDRIKNLSTQLFNIHFGPLPAYKGPVPVFWQLRNGEKSLGMAIHRLNDKFDEGAVIWAKDIPNMPHYNFRSVMTIFSQICIEGVFFILQMLLNNMPILNMDRKHILSSYHSRPSLENVSVNWSKMTSSDICNIVRACNPWNKGAITSLEMQEVKIMDAQRTDISSNAPAGSIIESGDRLLVACSDEKAINVSMLFFQEFFCPGWQAHLYGIQAKKTFS